MKRILALILILQAILSGCTGETVKPSKGAFSAVQVSKQLPKDDPGLVAAEVRRKKCESTATLIALAAGPHRTWEGGGKQLRPSRRLVTQLA